jgi:hypothetical protein
MKTTIILSPDKEHSERLRVLVNLLFPEVKVFCVSESIWSSDSCAVDLHLNYSAISRRNDRCRS